VLFLFFWPWRAKTDVKLKRPFYSFFLREPKLQLYESYEIKTTIKSFSFYWFEIVVLFVPKNQLL